MASQINPLFVCEEICDFDLPTPFQRVVVGQEQAGGGCTIHTKAILVESNREVSARELQELRDQLRDFLCK
jgi:hypothetical protein